MNQEHHNKIIIIAGILVLVIVAILGVVAIRGKDKKTLLPPPVSDADSQHQKLINAATAQKDYSIGDPEIQKLIKSASAPKNAGTISNREALIRAASGN